MIIFFLWLEALFKQTVISYTVVSEIYDHFHSELRYITTGVAVQILPKAIKSKQFHELSDKIVYSAKRKF